MKLSRAHFHFWMARQPVPGWVARIPAGPSRWSVQNHAEEYRKTNGIDALINQSAGIKANAEAHNIVSLLKSVRSSKTWPSLLAYCRHLSTDYWSLSNTPRRAAWAKKWARRIEWANTPRCEFCGRWARVVCFCSVPVCRKHYQECQHTIDHGG